MSIISPAVVTSLMTFKSHGDLHTIYETLNVIAGYISAVTCQPRAAASPGAPNPAADYLNDILATVTDDIEEVVTRARDWPAADAVENGYRVKILLTHELSDLSDPQEISKLAGSLTEA